MSGPQGETTEALSDVTYAMIVDEVELALILLADSEEVQLEEPSAEHRLHRLNRRLELVSLQIERVWQICRDLHSPIA